LARPLHGTQAMQTFSRPIIVVEVAANDVPVSTNVERARLRERDRKLRGPVWSQARGFVTPA
jgi:hypothetical protein